MCGGLYALMVLQLLHTSCKLVGRSILHKICIEQITLHTHRANSGPCCSADGLAAKVEERTFNVSMSFMTTSLLNQIEFEWRNWCCFKNSLTIWFLTSFFKNHLFLCKRDYLVLNQFYCQRGLFKTFPPSKKRHICLASTYIRRKNVYLELAESSFLWKCQKQWKHVEVCVGFLNFSATQEWQPIPKH